jgi:hypothetical protein
MKEGLSRSRPVAARAAMQPKFGRRSPSKGRPNWGRQLGRPTLTNDEWMAHFDFGAPALLGKKYVRAESTLFSRTTKFVPPNIVGCTKYFSDSF